jgi:pilus assembly protein CpaC
MHVSSIYHSKAYLRVLAIGVAALLVLNALPGAKRTAQAEGNRKESLELFVGDKWVIESKGVEQFAVATEGVVDMDIPPKAVDFLVTALAPGTTTIVLFMSDGTQVKYSVVVHPMRVSERDNIRLDFYFVELTRSMGRRIGVGWPGAVIAPASITASKGLSPSTPTTATATIATEVLPRLDLAQTNGWARVLREASVIVANGEQSMFESGGELNFRIEGAVSSSIEKIQFGSRITVKPKYDRTTSRLDLSLEALVSELTDVSGDGLPGRSFTNLNTVVNLELGQSIVLAGIHAKSTGRGSEGLPFLSQIPVVGYLFGTKSFRESETENLIFIVPTVVQAVDVSKRDLVIEAQEAFRRYEGGANGNKVFRKVMPVPTSAGTKGPKG